MRYFLVAAALVALSASASASDYMGWYLGAGIGYGYPALIPASGQRGCIDTGGKIFAHDGKLYCAHKVANAEKAGEARAVTREEDGNSGRGTAKSIYGQRVGFMWQGMLKTPDRRFNDRCAKQSGKVSEHKDGHWYCDQP